MKLTALFIALASATAVHGAAIGYRRSDDQAVGQEENVDAINKLLAFFASKGVTLGMPQSPLSKAHEDVGRTLTALEMAMKAAQKSMENLEAAMAGTGTGGSGGSAAPAVADYADGGIAPVKADGGSYYFAYELPADATVPTFDAPPIATIDDPNAPGSTVLPAANLLGA